MKVFFIAPMSRFMNLSVVTCMMYCHCSHLSLGNLSSLQSFVRGHSDSTKDCDHHSGARVDSWGISYGLDLVFVNPHLSYHLWRHQVVKKNIHITKRDLFYTDVKLFTKQEESDSILDDVSVMLGCTRTSLNVVASDKGILPRLILAR